MDQAQILATYSAAWSTTQQMLEAAQTEQWDHMIELEQGRDALMAPLMQAPVPIEPQNSAEISVLIRNILVVDQKIQGLTRVWMDEISGVLNSVQVEKKLLKAYEAF